MQPDTILLRYGELGLKSKQTRRKFIRRLILNMKEALREDFIDFTQIRKEYGRIFVETDELAALSVLSKVFGFVSLSPVYSCEPTLKEIRPIALALAKDHIQKTDSFAIRARRKGTHKFTSQELGEKIGSSVQKATKATVDLTNPSKELFIEVRDKKAYVFIENVPGTGGIPRGVEGRVLVRYDDEDSALAAWLMARRGCDIDVIASAKKKDEAEVAFKRLKSWLGDVKLHSARKSIPKLVADRKIKALVTNETLESIAALKKSNAQEVLPVFRPLLGLTEGQLHTFKTKAGFCEGGVCVYDPSAH